MITDEEIEKALDFMRDNAATAAQATANRIYLMEYRKVVRAQIMREHGEKSLGAQEREAEADSRYDQHLKVLEAAVERDEYLTWMMKAADAKISAWQTQSRNARV